MCTVHLKDGELYSLALRAEYPCKLFGILLYERFVYYPSFIYLYNQLCQYELRDISFIFWVIIQYDVTYLDFAQIVPVLITGRSFSWLLYPFDKPPSFCFLNTSYFLEPQDAPCSSYISTLLVLKSAIFSQRVLVPFNGE